MLAADANDDLYGVPGGRTVNGQPGKQVYVPLLYLLV
jgi:hypothetical protein